jgi:hypothetical protein
MYKYLGIKESEGILTSTNERKTEGTHQKIKNDN